MNQPRSTGWRSQVIPIVFIVLAVAVLQPLIESRERLTADSETISGAQPWLRQRIAGLSLTAPGRLVRASVSALGSESVPRSPLESYAFYELQAESVWLGFTQVRYSEDVEIRLDEIAGSTTDQVARVRGVRDLAFSNKMVRISGRDALRVRGAFTRAGTRERMEGLVLQDGQTVWQVMTVFEDRTEAERIADRILRSVGIPMAPPKAP